MNKWKKQKQKQKGQSAGPTRAYNSLRNTPSVSIYKTLWLL
jgi:hypothetical protein